MTQALKKEYPLVCSSHSVGSYQTEELFGDLLNLCYKVVQWVWHLLKETFRFPWWCLLSDEKRLLRIASDFESYAASYPIDKVKTWWSQTWHSLDDSLKDRVQGAFFKLYVPPSDHNVKKLFYTHCIELESIQIERRCDPLQTIPALLSAASRQVNYISI